MRPYANEEESKYPKVIMTSNDEWNPEILDHEIDNEGEEWFNAQEDLPLPTQLFDVKGNYAHEASLHNITMNHPELNDHALPDPAHHMQCFKGKTIDVAQDKKVTKLIEVKTHLLDFDKLRPHFAWLPADALK